MTTLNTLTARQQAQHTFYLQWAPRVAAFGVYNLPDNTLTHYRAGKKIDKQLAEFEKNSTRSANRATPLSENELNPILDEYLATYLDDGSKVGVFDRQTACVGVNKTRHDIVATTMSVHGQLAAIDTKYSGKRSSFDRMGNTLKGLLLAYNEQAGFDRFEVS